MRTSIGGHPKCGRGLNEPVDGAKYEWGLFAFATAPRPMDFPCTSCGACCRQIPLDSPMNLGDGVCRHLDTVSQRCSIYAQRPLICRVDDLYRERLAGSVTPRVYYLLQAHACAALDPRNASLPAIVANWVQAGRETGLPVDQKDAPEARPDMALRTQPNQRLDPAEATDGYDKLMAVVSTLLKRPEEARVEGAFPRSGVR